MSHEEEFFHPLIFCFIVLQEGETSRNNMELWSGKTWGLYYRGSTEGPQSGSGGTRCCKTKEVIHMKLTRINPMVKTWFRGLDCLGLLVRGQPGY